MKSIICIAFIMSFFSSFAQDADFSGKWKINKDKIEWGHAPEFVLSRAFDIKQKKKEIVLSRTVIDDQSNEHNYVEELSFDGKEKKVDTYDNYKRTSFLKWNDDKKTFVTNSQSVRPDGSYGALTIDTWSLQDDGKTLVVNRHVKQPDGSEYEIKAFYDKQ